MEGEAFRSVREHWIEGLTRQLPRTRLLGNYFNYKSMEYDFERRKIFICSLEKINKSKQDIFYFWGFSDLLLFKKIHQGDTSSFGNSSGRFSIKFITGFFQNLSCIWLEMGTLPAVHSAEDLASNGRVVGWVLFEKFL